MWNMKRVTVIPVVGALGAVSTDLEKWIEKIRIEVRVEHLQKNGITRNGQNFENGGYAIKETDLALETFGY